MQNKITLYIVCFYYILGCNTFLYGQSDIDSLAISISNKYRFHPKEILYLQTSKGIYETGEDLWFKAYQLNAQRLTLSAESQTLYLHMKGENDSVVWQEIYPIHNGISDGHVYIDKELPQGDYFLEAYTVHSFYADSTQLSSTRKIKIVENISGVANDTISKATDDKIQFVLLPEGGNLVAGLPSRLAFKATDGKGIPVTFSGTLYENVQPLKAFTDMHDGMGSINFTPKKEETYRIELCNGDSYSLPDIYPEGITLRLMEQTNDSLSFMVSKSKGVLNQKFYLLGQQRGVVCSIAKGMLQDSVRIKIPLNDFIGQGIAQFTLFIDDLKPIAERLVYILPDKKLHITITTDKESYTLREKATLKITATDENANPVQAHLGVSVYDESYNNPTDPVNIHTYFHLSSQINGSIYNPTYYFNEENKNRLQAFDLLLLTQGWRRYVWDTQTFMPHGEQVLTDVISGLQTFKSEKKSKKVDSSEQLIQVLGPDGDTEFVWTDSIGNFIIDTPTLNKLGSGYIYLKSMLEKKYTPQIHVNNLFEVIDSIGKMKKRYYPFIDTSKQKNKYVVNVQVVSSDSVILLDEVTVTGKKGRPLRDKVLGRLDSLAKMNLNPAWVCECPPLYLNDYLPGYTHHPSGSRNSIYNKKKMAPIHGKSYRVIKYEPIDGVWYVKDLKTVKYEGPYYSDEELLRMNNMWRVKGYYGVREFYQPDEFDIKSPFPDARNTLLWAPNVITDKKGEATVSFYCSDINNIFDIQVEGVDGSGLLGSEKSKFRVIRVPDSL